MHQYIAGRLRTGSSAGHRAVTDPAIGRAVTEVTPAGAEDMADAVAATREPRAGRGRINDHIPIIGEMPHGGYRAAGFGTTGRPTRSRSTRTSSTSCRTSPGPRAKRDTAPFPPVEHPQSG
jgi:acyl-CoA reductase-like NAD-dependent aldehyde dehydrogenase